MEPLDRARFDHVGFVTDTPQPGEIYLESERCWVTDPRDHPASIEWIRWEAGSPHRDDRPHVAFRVPDIEAAVAGQKVISPPAPTGAGGLWAFIEGPDGGVIELLHTPTRTRPAGPAASPEVESSSDRAGEHAADEVPLQEQVDDQDRCGHGTDAAATLSDPPRAPYRRRRDAQRRGRVVGSVEHHER